MVKYCSILLFINITYSNILQKQQERGSERQEPNRAGSSSDPLSFSQQAGKQRYFVRSNFGEPSERAKIIPPVDTLDAGLLLRLLDPANNIDNRVPRSRPVHHNSPSTYYSPEVLQALAETPESERCPLLVPELGAFRRDRTRKQIAPQNASAALSIRELIQQFPADGRSDLLDQFGLNEDKPTSSKQADKPTSPKQDPKATPQGESQSSQASPSQLLVTPSAFQAFFRGEDTELHPYVRPSTLFIPSSRGGSPNPESPARS